MGRRTYESGSVSRYSFKGIGAYEETLWSGAAAGGSMIAAGLRSTPSHYSDWMQVSSSYLDLFKHKDSQCIGMQEIIQYSEIIGGDSEGFGMDLNGIHEGFEL